MLRSAAVWGLKVWARSSWKDDISATTTSLGLSCMRYSTSGVPMFPPMKQEMPEASSMAVVSSVVVVFPLVAVIAITGVVLYWAKISSSPLTGTPLSRADLMYGMFKGIPGLGMITDALSNISWSWLPIITGIPSFFNAAASLLFVPSMSVAATPCPRDFKNRAMESPQAPKPTTSLYV